MEKIGWRFPPLSGGTRQSYTNNDIEGFKGQEIIDNLAREICQNSLDERDDPCKPVRVRFELKFVPNNQYEMFGEFKQCLQGCRALWQEEMDDKLSSFLNGAEKMLENHSIPVLVASDFNTSGAFGSKTNRLKTSWEALTSTDGLSAKDSGTSAGSYGIGKNAPFACSALSMVFYNTIAEDALDGAFVGVARVATLLDENGKETQRIGKYQVNNNEEEKWHPLFKDDICSFKTLFERSAKGTDIIIVGFNQVEDWIQNVEKAVLTHFFVAIAEEKLVVDLFDSKTEELIEINKNSIATLFEQFDHDRKMSKARQLYSAFTKPDCHTYLNILEDDDVEVFIKADSSYQRTIARFRSTGMLVGTYYKRIFQHYAAVIVVRGEKLSKLLRATEPPRHNRWDYALITNDGEKRKLAKESIEKIDLQVLNLLKNQFEAEVEDVVDAAGVSEYLPDEVEGLGESTKGDDILKPIIKLSKMKKSRKKVSIKLKGKQGKGEDEEGFVHGKRPKPKVPPIPSPKPVVPGPGTVSGAVPGDGDLLIQPMSIQGERAFPINPDQGIYKIVMKTPNSSDNMFVSCFALGEDGKQDALSLLSFTHQGKVIAIKDNKAGPISVRENDYESFIVRFQEREKMALKLSFTEEIAN